jgi:ribonuclease HI
MLATPEGKTMATVSRYLGSTTNNQAEFQALYYALEEAERLGATDLIIRADSELMVKQINGEYRVKNEGLKPWHARIMAKLDSFAEWHIEHVRREKNKEADKLANEAIDNHFG